MSDAGGYKDDAVVQVVWRSCIKMPVLACYIIREVAFEYRYLFLVLSLLCTSLVTIDRRCRNTCPLNLLRH